MKEDDLFSPSPRIEEQYRRSLSALMERFHHTLLGFGLTDPYDILRLLQEFAETTYFQDFAMKAASRLITMTSVANARSWREAASLSSRGRMIYQALQREMDGPVGMTIRNLVDQNARLISTFPLEVAKQANQFILEESQKGRRSEDIAEDLIQQFPSVSKGRISLISTTETSKASTALTRARAGNLDLRFYVWQTSRDARVRPSHRWMGRDNGVLCAFSNNPDPEALSGKGKPYGSYGPGETFRCRCWPYVLMDIGDVEWPHRYYDGAQVRMISRANFTRMAGMEAAAA